MIVMLVEEKTFFFEIRKNILVLTNSMAKDHLLKADLSYDGLSIGTCKIPNNMLNKLTITYQDEFRLQCVIFHIEGINSAIYDVNSYLEKELKSITGCKKVISDNVIVKGMVADWSSTYLRWNTFHGYIFYKFDKLRDFVLGDNVLNLVFKHEAPERISKNIDTVVITDSYMQNLDFLSCCDDLKSIIIERSVIKDFTALEQLENLSYLYIEAVELPNSGIVKKLRKLKRLGLVYCDLKEIEGLAEKPDLIFCDLSFNNIGENVSMKPLFDSHNLIWLCLSSCEMSDLNVKFWPELRGLDVNYSAIKNINNLQFCKKLQFIDCSASNIEKFQGIDKLKGLAYDYTYKSLVASRKKFMSDKLNIL